MTFPVSSRGLPDRTSGDRDASQPQVRDQKERSFSNAANTFKSGEAEQSTVLVDPADPVFAGHYPGCPVLPGLYVLDHVDQVVSAGGQRMTALDRARFLRPVRPGDELRIDVTRSGDGSCVATVHTAAGPVAEFRLRYEGCT